MTGHTRLVGAYHEALQQRRRDQQSEEFRLQMHQRNTIEGTISELVRSHGLRRYQLTPLGRTVAVLFTKTYGFLPLPESLITSVLGVIE